MDTTIWKCVPNFEGIYEVSNTGLVKTLRKEKEDNQLSATNKILRPAFDKDAYLSVRLWKSDFDFHARIHRLVAFAFVENPENKPFVDHINGVRWDNRAENLRWVTQSENQQFSYDFSRKIKNGKTIDQFDLKGNFIKRYRVIRDVEKSGFNSRSVNNVVRGTRKTAFGFIWKYAEIETL